MLVARVEVVPPAKRQVFEVEIFEGSEGPPICDLALRSLCGAQQFPAKARPKSAFDLCEEHRPIEKARGVIGLHSKLPVHGLVGCVDEQSRVDVAEEKASRPPRRARHSPEELLDTGHAGSVLLPESVDVVARTVTEGRKARETVADYRAFLDRMDVAVPDHTAVHLVVDNYAQVRAWMYKQARFQLRFVLRHDSWPDQVDHWFQRRRRGPPTWGSISASPWQWPPQRTSSTRLTTRQGPFSGPSRPSPSRPPLGDSRSRQGRRAGAHPAPQAGQNRSEQ